MYEAFYQLITNPFRLSPDPVFSFQHRTYRKAMTRLRHALLHEEGFILITGQPGTGKTALVNDLLRTLMPGQTVVAKLISTQLTAYELLDQVAYSFNFDHEDCSKAEVLVQLERFLRQQYQNGRRSLLIVDEAQDMGEDALEELYQLANLQYKNHQLLQMILIGPEQFLDTVIIPSLEQLHQRLFAVTLLEPLDAENTEAYIKHRLRRAGWMGDPLISTETYAMIQQYSQGIPRRINQICSCLFLHGSIAGKHRLCTADLRIAIEGFKQELLMSMYKEGLTEAVVWPVEQFEETYKEEQKKDLQCRHPCCYPQKPSARVVETRRHILVREPVSVVGAEIGNNQASTHHKKLRWHLTLLVLFTALGSYASKARSLLRDRIEKTSIPMIRGKVVPVLVLITITLAAYFGDVDSDQPVRSLGALALNQTGTQRLENLATEDRELGSVQPQLHTPAPEEQASRGTRNSAGEAVSKTRVGEKIFAAPTMEIRRPLVLELATMEVTHSVSDPEIKLLRIHAATDPRAALGNELTSDVFQQQSTLPSYVTQLETLSSPAAGKSNISTSGAATGVQSQETIIGNGPWFINLASFLHKANAERFVEDLESKGVAVCLYQVTVRGEDYWRVHMCGFATAAEANAKASLIKEKFGFKDAWLTKR
jgi:type II secretory pathway predicted ATPase ExeA